MFRNYNTFHFILHGYKMKFKTTESIACVVEQGCQFSTEGHLMMQKTYASRKEPIYILIKLLAMLANALEI